MAEYKIQRWDSILLGNNIHPFPMIYFKPDEAFLKFAEENNSTLFVKIENTGSIYDGKVVVAILNSSASNPGCRPNFFKKTGLYTLSLYSAWYGYPPRMGTAVISGLKGEYSLPPVQVPEFEAPKPIMATEYYKEESKGLNNVQIAGLFICLFILLGVLVWISLVEREKKKA